MVTTREAESKKRLLWACADAADRSLLESAAATFGLHVRFCTPTEIPGLLRAPDELIGLELVGESADGLATIRELHARAPGAAIVAASRHVDVELLRSAMEAGASDVITLPLVSHELHKALVRVTRPVAAASAPAAMGQVISVYGARGGLGTTTLAVNLAFKLGSITKADVALVDLDLQRGDVAAFVNLDPVHSLASIAAASGEVDDIFLASALTRHPSGVALLAAPLTMEEAELVTDREVDLAIRLMRSRFAYTVVDTPRAITSAVVAAFEDSDRIFVLTDLSVPSVRATRRVFELLDRLEIPIERSELLVTEIMPGPLELKKATQAIGREAFATIPRDESASSAMNDGVPLNGRPSRLALALDGLARRIAGVEGSRSGRGILGRIFPKGVRP